MPPINPFEDDESSPRPGIRNKNPFLSASAAPAMLRSNNPFANPSPARPLGQSFSAGTSSRTLGGPKPTTNPFEVASSSNPFDNDARATATTLSPPSRAAAHQTNPFAVERNTTTTNPFADEGNSSANSSVVEVKSTTNNPFDIISPPRTTAGSSNHSNPFDDNTTATSAPHQGFSSSFVSNLKRPVALSNLFRGKTNSVEGESAEEDDSLPATATIDDSAASASKSTVAHRRGKSMGENLQSSAMGWLKRGITGVNGDPLMAEDASTIASTTNKSKGPIHESSSAAATSNTTNSSSNKANNPFQESQHPPPGPSVSFLNDASKNFNNASAANNNKDKKKKTKKKSDKKNKIGIVEGMKKGKLHGAPQWPYDNYQSEAPGDSSQSKPRPAYSFLDNNKEFGEMSNVNQGKAAITSNGLSLEESIISSSKLYERPTALPSISEAAHELSLVEFESKAEERAIAIVSMWLHDSGLIDDLLVTGTQGYAALRKRSNLPAGFNDDATVLTTKTSEGVEIGLQGFPMTDTFKMEKEVEWMRNRVQRELTLVNARLNDGVAASGAEVQELVNAVAATKGDLGRLRTMSTYITQGVNNQDEFILTNCPRLRNIMNARRNLFTCFRDLEFFDQMPTTCNRLREELHSGEWTTEEWKAIRSVSMEHVELEILLVEAEAGMKARLKGENGAMNEFVGNHSNYRDDAHLHAIEKSNYEAVDRFLSAHVTNVWELGDEIKMRIMSGLGSSFDLARNNPADMVALVEAVEVYERAAEHYKALYDDSMGTECSKLRFTDMRASALKQMYEHFQTRGLDLFRTIQMRAAEVASEGDAENVMFSAVLQAATELVSEVEIVRNVLLPCFPPHWAVDVLWSSCAAYVCSNEILQQIGGPQGTGVQDLTVTQLLDLVAWVECFREHIEESFPHVAKLRTSKNTYFASMPNLFTEDKKKGIDMEKATDSLAWANNTLWDVHRLAQSEFLQRVRIQIDDWLDNVYGASRTHEETGEGKLTTSLCEDLFSLVGVQLRTIREHLSPSSEALVSAVCLIFSNLRMKQIHGRDYFLQDLESACAAANDFTRMSELCEEALAELQSECKFDEDVRETLEASANEVLAVYSADAVYAAQSTHEFIFEPIVDAIAGELFGVEWEQNLTHNELALTLVRTIEDFMGDLEQFLDDFLLVKVADAIVSATVVFYVRCLLVKAENHIGTRGAHFQDTQMALDRMTGDIRVFTEFFEGLVPRMPSLKRVIEREFEFFTALYELISIAAGLSESDASNFIIVVHKLLMGNIDLTKHFVGDIWHLVNPAAEKEIWDLIDSMEEQLEAIAPKSEAAIRKAMDRQQVPGLRLDRMMADLYLQSKRKLPIMNSTFEKMVHTLKRDWTGHEKEGRKQDVRTNALV